MSRGPQLDDDVEVDTVFPDVAVAATADNDDVEDVPDTRWRLRLYLWKRRAMFRLPTTWDEVTWPIRRRIPISAWFQYVETVIAVKATVAAVADTYTRFRQEGWSPIVAAPAAAGLAVVATIVMMGEAAVSLGGGEL